MEHRIGEIVILSDGSKAEVVEATENDCEGCFLYEKRITDPCTPNDDVVCSGHLRADGKNVIYKEIKEE